MKIKHLPLTLLCIFFTINGFAQLALNAQGGNKIIPAYTQSGVLVGSMNIDWSFGEMMLVSDVKDCCLRLTQGLIQYDVLPDLFVSNAIQETEMKIYPNPTSGNFKIFAGFLKPGKLTFTMYNEAGQMIFNRKENYTGFVNYDINITKNASGVYPIHVMWEPTNEPKRTKTYRIIKQ